MFSCGFNSGHLAGRGTDVARHLELGRKVPTGLVEQKRCMACGSNVSGNCGQVQVHRCGVAPGQDQSDSLALARADSAKDVGGGGPLVARRRWSGAASCPTTGDLVLLADPGLVTEPDGTSYQLARGNPGRGGNCSTTITVSGCASIRMSASGGFSIHLLSSVVNGNVGVQSLPKPRGSSAAWRSARSMSQMTCNASPVAVSRRLSGSVSDHAA